MPVSLGLGSSGHLARKGAGKGAHTASCQLKGAVWRIVRKTIEESICSV